VGVQVPPSVPIKDKYIQIGQVISTIRILGLRYPNIRYNMLKYKNL